jgi:hypothetical protein
MRGQWSMVMGLDDVSKESCDEKKYVGMLHLMKHAIISWEMVI